MTGLSDRAVASGAAVSSVSSVPVAAAQLPWEATRLPMPHIEEKSDTSSCDSPLRVDLEDTNPILSEQGSRPSTPKVPPLKIIIPPKAGGASANVSKPQGKPALPYVLNPTVENECWDGVEEAAVQDGLDYSSLTQPVPRSVSETTSKPSARNLDVEETASRGSDMQADHADGLGEKSDEGKEKRPTRTLRSHTAMLQQQKDKMYDKDKNGKLI